MLLLTNIQKIAFWKFDELIQRQLLCVLPQILDLFQRSVAFHIETIHLISIAKQVIAKKQVIGF